jgi:hypothetical protein
MVIKIYDSNSEDLFISPNSDMQNYGMQIQEPWKQNVLKQSSSTGYLICSVAS